MRSPILLATLLFAVLLYPISCVEIVNVPDPDPRLGGYIDISLADPTLQQIYLFAHEKVELGS